MDLYPNQVKLFTFKQLLSKVYIKWWQDIRTGREASETKELIVGGILHTFQFSSSLPAIIISGNGNLLFVDNLQTPHAPFVRNLKAIMEAVEGNQNGIPSENLYFPALGFDDIIASSPSSKKRSLKQYLNPASKTVKEARSLINTIDSILWMDTLVDVQDRLTVRIGESTIIFDSQHQAPLQICLNGRLLTWPNGKSDRWRCEPIEELMEVWPSATEALNLALEDIAKKIEIENDKVINKLKSEFAVELLVLTMTE